MILCRSDSVVDVTFEGFDEAEILSLFVGAGREELNEFKIQMKMSAELHEKLEREKGDIVNATRKEMEKVFSFFKKIKNGECFCILPENLLRGKSIYDRDKIAAREQTFLKYKNWGYHDEFIVSIMDKLENTCEKYLDELSEIYEIHFFSKKNAKEWFGEKDKEKRVCRFCGRKMPEATFRDAAHTIPFALGNRIFFNNYECDECNHYFGEEIEPHLVKWLGILIVIFGGKGRNGVPDLKFDNGMISHSKENSGMAIICRKENNDLNSIIDGEKNGIIDLGEGEQYIPVRAYKALVKIALGFVPEEKMQLFKNTIQWVMNGFDVVDGRLPKVACCLYPQELNQQPEVTLYLRKNSSDEKAPAAVAVVMMCGIILIYIIPFVLNETTNYAIGEKYNEYWDIFNLYSKSPHKWYHVDLSGTKSISQNLRLNFNND